MTASRSLVVFEGVSRVVAEPLRFKAKLAIGENAYASLRMINRTREVWDVLGAAGGGAALAKAAALGLGAATTPVGWVAFAALASGGACYGLYRWLGNTKGERVIEIPKFLNTPLDTLGLALFDLIAPLALRLAAVDGAVERAERAALAAHLVDEWGLDADFVQRALAQIEPEAQRGDLAAMAQELSTFLHTNPDCHHPAIAADLGEFLRRLLEAGGPLSPAETAALAATVETLQYTPPGPLAQAASTVGATAREAAQQLGVVAREAAERTREKLPSAEALREAAQKAARQAAEQAQVSVEKASAWAQVKLPVAADQVQDVARRSVDLARDGLERLARRKPK